MLGRGAGALGLTEPDTGSDAANLSTRAQRTDGGWSITGHKQWISLGTRAELALIQTDPELGRRGLAAFLVPTAADGFLATEIHGKLGLRAVDTSELSLDGVEVADDALLGRSATALRWRCPRSTPAASAWRRGAWRICQGSVDASVCRRSTLETSVAKLYATEASIRSANAAIQVHGGSDYVDDFPVERYLRDARVTTLYEGTSQIQKLIIGRAVTGEDAMT